MPDPARAVIMRPVNTGASSCASEMPDGRADEALLLEDSQRGDRLLRGDRAREESDQHDDRQRADADELHLLEEQAQAERPPKQPAHRAARA